MDDQLLKIRGLCKGFPGVRALAGVDFNLRRGEIHALMGENGAGKSTLIKTLTGVHRRDAGDIWLAGAPVSAQSPRHAEALGIKTVYQEVNLIPHLSIAENIMLGRQPKRWGAIRWRGLRRQAQQALDRLGLSLDLDRELCACSVAVQQMVAIVRAVSQDAQVLILDEPTSSLDQKEVDELFVVMKGLRQRGLGIIFVTHFLDQVYRISDRVTVLRAGVLVGEYAAAELPVLKLVGKMLGKTVAEVKAFNAAPQSDGLLVPPNPKIDGPKCVIATAGLGKRGSVEPFDLQIRAGEVVGLAGLLGSGRTEVARLLFGLDVATTGTLTVDGKSFSRWSPRKAIDAGIAFCPEDRKVDGVIAELSVRENILLAMQASRSTLMRNAAEDLPRRDSKSGSWWQRAGRFLFAGRFKTVSLAQQTAIANHYIERLKIKTPSCETAVGTLSGGNQQKVLLARWLAMAPKLLILDEPTRGIDIGAKSEIESLIESLRQEGMAILFISSELDELVRTCQRVIVMRDRKKMGIIDHDLSADKIMSMIAATDE